MQVTLKSIPAGGDIGLEAHPQTDQFPRRDAGRGRVQMGVSSRNGNLGTLAALHRKFCDIWPRSA